MAAVLIRKTELTRLGEELIKEVYYFLNDEEYILKEFPEIREVKKNFEKNIVYKIYNLAYDEDIDDYEKKLEILIECLKDGKICVKDIYKILEATDLSELEELNEDIYYKNKAFLEIYEVFEFHSHYLEY